MRGTILTLTLAALGAAACGRHEAPKAAEPPAGPARDVTTAEVVAPGGAGEVAVPGAVQARKRAALSARMPASVVELPYQEGQWVKAGAVVVRLDDAALRAAVAAAEAGVKAAESDLERTKSLLEKGAATPARARADDRRRERGPGAAHRRRRTASPTRRCGHRSPAASPSRRVNLGDVVNPGMPLIEIEGEGGLELRATVESGDRRDAAARARSSRRMVDGQAAPLAATVTADRPVGRPDDAPLRGEGRPARRLRPARRSLRAAARPRRGRRSRRSPSPPRRSSSAAASPASSSRRDGKARLRWVATGARDGDTVEVRAGLEAGERVVLEPAGLADGAPVRVAAASAAEAR